MSLWQPSWLIIAIIILVTGIIILAIGIYILNLKPFLKKPFKRVPLPYWGIIATIILVTGFIIPSIAYSGEKGERYSFLNHSISMLGEVGVSELAIFFNICLIIGGVFTLVFFTGLSLYVENKMAYLGGIIGVVSSIGGSFVGIFPMNYYDLHWIVSLIFFFGEMLAVAVFSIAILIDDEKKIHWIFSILGVIVVVFFGLLLFYPYAETDLARFYNDNLLLDRPAFLLHTFFEWMTLITIISWGGLISINFLIKKINII
ncbi:MAG: DUF998 domain-containing protein [Promethearchaeota archaeon]